MRLTSTDQYKSNVTLKLVFTLMKQRYEKKSFVNTSGVFKKKK